MSTLVISLLLLPFYCRCLRWLLSDELIDTNGTDRRIFPMLLHLKKLLDESVYQSLTIQNTGQTNQTQIS
jgi:hypothetical protein